MENKTEPQNFLILNNVRSCENVGSCFRICDSCNVNLVLQGITPHPKIPNDTRLPYIINSDIKKIAKTATESINNVNFSYYTSITEVIDFVNERGITLYCLEIDVKGAQNIFSPSTINKPFALVVGNEKEGINPLFLQKCKECFYIPMFGKNKSLNVSIASAVALYQLIIKS